MTYLFIDTNVLLHYRRMEEVDWAALSNSVEITLVLCPAVIRELDRHKVSHPQSKFRKRAQEIITKLHSRLSSVDPNVVSDRVRLELVSDDPSLNFEANKLRQELADDWLIASALEWVRNHTTDETLIVSADLGISIKAKNRGIPVLVPLESDKLAEELDADEKRIRQLQQELKEIKNTLPILKICFKDAETVTRVKIESPNLLESSIIALQMNEVRLKHPTHPLRDEPTQPAIEIKTVGQVEKFLKKGGKIERLWPREEVLRHNAEIQSFYTEYEDYLRTSHEYRNMQYRTIQLEIWLENSGTSPAEDIDVQFHFPDGFQLFDAEEGEFPKAPEPPEPPLKLGEFKRPNFDALMGLGSYGLRPALMNLKSNISSPSIRRTNSYDVRSHIARAKHGIQIRVAKFAVLYDSYETAGSFRIDYAILAANIPKTTTGHLDVVLEKAN